MDNCYYSLDNILTYNRFLTMVVGGRGTGKSYAAKKMLIKNFLKKKEEFVYIRRTKIELEKAATQEFFKDIAPEFPDVEFMIKADKIYINDELAGHFIPLSGQAKYKSIPYPNVKFILFDEFIDFKGRYLKNEIFTFLELISTIVRDRENVRCILLGNNVSVINPYYTYFNVRPTGNRNVIVSKTNPEVILEIVQNTPEMDSRLRTSKFGRFIQGTAYAEYNIDNKSLNDNNNFILKDKPTDSKFLFSLIYNGKEYGVWESLNDGIYHINNQFNTNSFARYSLQKKDHTDNVILLLNIRKQENIKNLILYFQYGMVYFNNLETKNTFFEIFSLLNLK